jgi:hypothetical protein
MEEAVKLACSDTPLHAKIATVKRVGISFRPNIDFAEKACNKNGENRDFIAAVYQAVNKQPCPESLKPAKIETRALPDGPPLSLHQVILLLDAKVDEGKFGSLIEKRKVGFEVLSAVPDLKAAGANEKLIGVMLVNQKVP